MTSIPLSLRDELIVALRHTEQQTEEIFMVLAESLPSLVGEMNRSLERSKRTIDCMEGGDESCGDDLDLTGLLATMRRTMEHGSERFREMSAADETLFSQLKTGIDQLTSISNAIDGIRMDSEDMELVSLNAMTVALKAGNAGRAFSYITEELKRLANRTIALAERISGQGNMLLSAFKELEQALDDAREFQTGLIKSFEQRIYGSFDDFQSAVDETVRGLRRLYHESTELRGPLNGLMEAIQLQDLIRQSIDHIILALEAIRPAEELSDEEDLLDELAFIRQIPDLAVSLIEDVVGQIRRSVDTFQALIQEAEAKRNKLDEDRRRFIAGESSGTADLDQRFEHATQLLQDLIGDLDRNIQKKELLVQRSTGITADVQTLEDQFRSFNTLVTRFHSIDIASRIEVAKQEVLRSMGTTSNQMNALTKQIEGDVEASLETTQVFIKTTSTVISEHQKTFLEQREFVESFSTTVRDGYEDLERSREGVLEVVRGFSLFTDGFHRVFDKTKENGERLARLGDELYSQTKKLQEMHASIEEQYHAELRTRGIDNWTIENDRLQEIIERFTIFDHKQRAGDLAGISVDEGIDAGEVTLF